MKKKLHQRSFSEVGEQRLIFLNQQQEAKELIDQNLDQEARDLSQEMLGKSKEEADGMIDNELRDKQQAIKGLVESWHQRKWLSVDKHNLVFGKSLNTQKIEEIVSKAAQARVENMVEGLGVEGEQKSRFAKESLSLLHAKGEILDEFRQDVSKEIQEKEARLKMVKDARSALGFWRSFGKNKDLQQQVDRLNLMKEKIEEIKKEVMEKEKKYSKGVEVVRDYDQRIRNIVLYGNPSLAGELNTAIRENILNPSSGAFEAFLKEKQESGELDLTAQEIDKCNDMMNFLVKGRTFGKPKATDVQDYYIKEQLDTGVLNQKDDNTEKRIQRLGRLPVGQEVHLGELGLFHVVRKPSYKATRFLIRNTAGERAYINIADPQKPLLTLRKSDGSYERRELSVEGKQKPSLTAIEFKSSGVIPIGKLNESTKEEQDSTKNERLEQVERVVNDLEHSSSREDSSGLVERLKKILESLESNPNLN